jgi:hypothetical protein
MDKETPSATQGHAGRRKGVEESTEAGPGNQSHAGGVEEDEEGGRTRHWPVGNRLQHSQRSYGGNECRTQRMARSRWERWAAATVGGPVGVDVPWEWVMEGVGMVRWGRQIHH